MLVDLETQAKQDSKQTDEGKTYDNSIRTAPCVAVGAKR